MGDAPAGVAAAARALLGSERVRFAPALAGDGTATWTLRDALVTAVGCDRRAGPLAYWEWESLYASLESARRGIASRVDLPDRMDLEQWANQRPRTAEEVLEALEAVPEDEDVPVPAAPVVRPWCDAKVISRCRIPFIPLAAVTHAWGDMDRPWSDVAGEFGLTAELTSWELLRRIDPTIRDTTASAPVAEVAWDLRRWKGLDPLSDSFSTARWLFSVAEADSSVTLEGLRDRASEELDAA